MIKVISFKICPFVQRVTALLEAKEMPYEVEYIHLNNKPDWFLKLSPTGQVPILVAKNGTALFESDAIAEYLDDIQPGLEPYISPEQRALDRAWSYQASKHYLVQCGTMRSSDKETLQEKTENLEKAFAKVEAKLEKGPYFKGETLSNIDIAWLPLLYRADIVERHSGYDFFDPFPKVKAWQREVLKTGLAKKSVSEDFVEAFSKFYLSDETYLGRRLKDVSPVGKNKTISGCC